MTDNTEMQTDREKLEQEIHIAVGKLILSQLPGRRALAHSIFDELLPQVSRMPNYNRSLKTLTEMTVDVAGGEDDYLEDCPGKPPCLKSLIKRPTLDELLPRDL